MVSTVAQYMNAKQQATPEERQALFVELAASFGPVDSATQAFRTQCQDAGFSAVFHDGLSREEAVSVLQSKETAELLKASALPKL